MISLRYSMIVPAVLFSLGLAGLIIRRNFLFILISVEIMINSGALACVIAGSFWHNSDGQVIYVLAISVAAAEASIGLVLLLKMYEKFKTLNIDSVSELSG